MALDVPVTVNNTEEGENERLDYTVSAMQGYRLNMEDAHAIVLNLDAATGTSFFGVYDGHGGPAVSKYCVRHLHIELHRHERFRDNLRNAIERTFLRMDEMMKDRSAGRELSGYGGNEYWEAYRKAMRKSLFIPFCQKPEYRGPENNGCTACVVLIRGNLIIVGNAGDSRCVLSRNNLAIELSNDFKPNLPAERQRIEAAGHAVTFSERGNVHRIDDGIAISRSLGDLLYKDNNHLGPQEQAITAFPEVRTQEVTQDDQFLIIACDGIWDCVIIQQAVYFIRIFLNASTERSENKRAMQGYRVNMEDAHAIALNLDAATGTSFFGVYDGHGGPAVSKYYARNLHIELRGHERFRDNIRIAIERTFLRMDEMMKDRRAGRELSGYGGNENWDAYRKAMRTSRFVHFYQKPAYRGPESDGGTTCVVLIRGNQIIVGNAGDSRCVLSRNNQAIDLSNAFKPNLRAERERMEAAGVHLLSLFPLTNAVFQDVLVAFICEALFANCLVQPQGRDNMSVGKVRAHKVLPSLTDQASVNQVVYQMLKNNALITKFLHKIRNTITFVLDGSNYEVWEQYAIVMAHIRFWFVSNGMSINLLPVLGYDRIIHMVPIEGTMHLLVKYGLKSVDLIMDARAAWLYGGAGLKSVVFQFERQHCIPYINHEYALSLNGDGRYRQVAKKGIGGIPIGIDALRTLCLALSEVDENSNPAEVEEQLGVAIAHFMEPLKFHKAYEIVSDSILTGEMTTFDEKDPTLKFLVKLWGKAAQDLGNYLWSFV